MTEFGRLLVEYRQAHGITQAQVAAWMGYCCQYIYRVEKGKHCPSRQFVETLVGALSLPAREANIFRLSAGYAPTYGEGVRYGALPAL